MYITIILILTIIILLLSIGLYVFSKKAIFLLKKEKDLIEFVLKLYVEYGDELDILPNDEHKEIIIKKINDIRKRLS